MPTRLILNADDFGLTPGVNRSIAQLHRAGALTSATLMATGAAFADAVRIAHDLPTLGVGCHIVLTDGIPAADPARIPSLLHTNGSAQPALQPSLARFAIAALRGRVVEAEIELEAEAQIGRLHRAGISPTHLDTHKHAHLFPSVLRPLLRVALRNGIPAIRNPFEHTWSLALNHGSRLRRAQIHLLHRLHAAFTREIARTHGRIHTTDGTIGVSATGDLTPASLGELLAHLPPGTWELVCHPGENDADLNRVRTRLRIHREVERDALLALIPAFFAAHPAAERIHFGDLAPQPQLVHTLAAQEHS